MSASTRRRVSSATRSSRSSFSCASWSAAACASRSIASARVLRLLHAAVRLLTSRRLQLGGGTPRLNQDVADRLAIMLDAGQPLRQVARAVFERLVLVPELLVTPPDLPEHVVDLSRVVPPYTPRKGDLPEAGGRQSPFQDRRVVVPARHHQLQRSSDVCREWRRRRPAEEPQATLTPTGWDCLAVSASGSWSSPRREAAPSGPVGSA